MRYTSTRDTSQNVASAQAILAGLAPGGGLFVPLGINSLDFAALAGRPYHEVACEVLRPLLPDYDPAFLARAVRESYGDNFGGRAGHLHSLSDSLHVLELWHGPTAAFKDYALQLMPRLLVEARRMLKDEGETVILVATSGDTGSAALAGYSDVPGIKIAVFYPQNGTSALQRLQMTTRQGGNVAVYGVDGNFDDAQRGVKAAFTDEGLAARLEARGQKLSSANSINWGRLAPQVVYYVTSYLGLVQRGVVRYGDKVDYYVPTGNFGDIMAGWYARAMGLPVGRLVCASNKNNVLADFFATGHYDARRDFYKTSSPSMDILVSSNLERLLYHAGAGDEKVRLWMGQLAQTGEYRVDAPVMERIRGVFAGGWADEDAVYAGIRDVFGRYGYLCDPHTAVAFKVREQLEPAPGRPSVILSTASPFKFCDSVLKALGRQAPADPFEALRELEAVSGQRAPAALVALEKAPQRFTGVIPPQDIPKVPLRL